MAEKQNEIVALPTIFKRTSTGKVQQWTVEIDNDKFRTISGQVGGKSVTSEWTVCKGKNGGKANATTGVEQALKEATAKRKLKLESEYRDTADDVDDLDFREPLLAKDFKEYVDEIVYPVWSQPKLDGVRNITLLDGMFSRNGKKIVAAPHVRQILDDVYNKYPKLELDGELYNHKLKDNFDKIISLVRRGKPTEDDYAESAKMVQYWIYDVRFEKMPFNERYAFLLNLFSEFPDIKKICKLVPTSKVENRGALDAIYEEYLVDGYEGQMVRLNGKGYEFKRSKNLLKRKEFIDQEFEIKDIIEGEGNRSGMAGYMTFEIDGKMFKANMRGGMEQYKEWLNNKHLYVGKQATLRYQNLTPDGIPRFGVVVLVDREQVEGKANPK